MTRSCGASSRTISTTLGGALAAGSALGYAPPRPGRHASPPTRPPLARRFSRTPPDRGRVRRRRWTCRPEATFGWLAEGVGFEPTTERGPSVAVFKTAALGHYASPPCRQAGRSSRCGDASDPPTCPQAAPGTCPGAWSSLPQTRCVTTPADLSWLAACRSVAMVTMGGLFTGAFDRGAGEERTPVRV